MIERRQRSKLVFVGLLLLSLSGHAHAEEPTPGDARSLFRHGLELVDAGRFEEAAVAFERAYVIRPNASVLFNEAMAEAAARRPSRAIQTFDRYLQDSNNDADAHRIAEVQAMIAKLKKQVGSVDLKPQPAEAELRIDGRPVPAGAVFVDPGSHTIEASAPGYIDTDRTLVIGEGELQAVELVLVRKPEPLPATPTLAPAAAAEASGSLLAQSSAKPAWQLLGQPQRPADKGRGRSRLAAASGAGAGLLLVGLTAGLLIDNGSRHETWRQEQATLDQLWRTADSPANGPNARQAQNDQLGRRITVQDEVAVGTAVAGAACLIATAFYWFTSEDGPPPTVRASSSKNQATAAFNFSW